jgi:uncharacterized protein (UPF0332 family)
MARAELALGSAQADLERGDSEFAISRAYYGMFYATVGLLHERGLAFRKHTAVHAALAEHFTRSGTLDPKYHRWLLDASRARNSADYDVEVDFNPEDAATSIERAREFVAAVQRLLLAAG